MLEKIEYIDTSDCFEEMSFQTQQQFFNAGHLLWGSDSADTQQNLTLLKKYCGVFQQADLNLFS